MALPAEATDRRFGVLVLVPTFNDHARIAQLLREIRAVAPGWKVLLVDDGSSSPLNLGSAQYQCLSFRMPDNFGLGAVTHVAFDHALQMNYQAVVRIDGDGQHPVREITRLVSPLKRGEADLVVGSRTNHASRSNVRRLVKWYFSGAARLITGGKAPRDVNSGFFAINLKGIRKLNQFELERYPEPQLFVLACRGGLRVKEIFVEQLDRKYGRSSLGLLHALRMFYRFNIFLLEELIRGKG